LGLICGGGRRIPSRARPPADNSHSIRTSPTTLPEQYPAAVMRSLRSCWDIRLPQRAANISSPPD
jgi:hypothetical protein